MQFLSAQVNEVVRHVSRSLPADCVLFVMGDHGMTMTGDHGGDSRDEVSAALFVYGKNLDFGSSNKTAASVVDQVDLVPTFSLLLGIPIPFSNLGRVIRGLWSGAAQADSLLRYVHHKSANLIISLT